MKTKEFWVKPEEKKSMHVVKKALLLSFIITIILLLSLCNSDLICLWKGTAWSSWGLGEIQR